jgi:hypothetical protein
MLMQPTAKAPGTRLMACAPRVRPVRREEATSMAHIDARAADGSDAVLEWFGREPDTGGAVGDLARTEPAPRPSADPAGGS